MIRHIQHGSHYILKNVELQVGSKIEKRLNRFTEEINNLYLNEKFKTIISVENIPENDKKILVGDNIFNIIENTKKRKNAI